MPSASLNQAEEQILYTDKQSAEWFKMHQQLNATWNALVKLQISINAQSIQLKREDNVAAKNGLF